jgi:predicted nucleic acid-binding Zn ribbon protein
MNQATVYPGATFQNMPNKSRPHKRSVPQRASRPPRTRAHSASQPRHSGSVSQPAHSVKDLLTRAVPVLSQAADQSARQAFWRPWLESHLPPELAPQITGITERDGTLTVFAASSAWSARLRYAMLELSGHIREAQPDITEVTVRVLPRRSK